MQVNDFPLTLDLLPDLGLVSLHIRFFTFGRARDVVGKVGSYDRLPTRQHLEDFLRQLVLLDAAAGFHVLIPGSAILFQTLAFPEEIDDGIVSVITEVTLEIVRRIRVVEISSSCANLAFNRALVARMGQKRKKKNYQADNQVLADLDSRSRSLCETKGGESRVILGTGLGGEKSLFDYRPICPNSADGSHLCIWRDRKTITMLACSGTWA